MNLTKDVPQYDIAAKTLKRNNKTAFDYQFNCFNKSVGISSLPNPVDTGRKLNLHKTFKRRPGRLLTVLCRFNLRPVSTGKDLKFTGNKRDKKIGRADITSQVMPK